MTARKKCAATTSARKQTARKSTASTTSTRKTSGRKQPGATRSGTGTSAAMRTLPKGTAVAWNTAQGETHGTVERTLTAPMEIKGHHVAASPDNPQVLVRSATTGARAAHTASALTKRARKS